MATANASTPRLRAALMVLVAASAALLLIGVAVELSSGLAIAP